MTVDRTAELEAEVKRLSKLVQQMMKAGGKNAIPKGECHVGQDPASCPAANPYRYQRGCRGTSCVTNNSSYYDEHPRSKVKATKVAPPKRKNGSTPPAAVVEPTKRKRVLRG